MTAFSLGLTTDQALALLRSWGPELSGAALQDALRDLVERTSIGQIPGHGTSPNGVTILYSGPFNPVGTTGLRDSALVTRRRLMPMPTPVRSQSSTTPTSENSLLTMSSTSP